MIGIDFNLSLNLGQYTFTDLLKGLANAYRTDNFLTTIGFPSQKAIRQVRSTISRKLSGENFFLFRSVSLNGICSDNLSSESAGHRNMFAGDTAKAIPLQHTWESFTEHLGKCERTPGLENIRRLRKGFDKQSSNTLRQRRLWNSTEPRGLCSGFNHHRFMSDTVSMGKISQTQGRSKDTYTDGPERLYTNVYPHYRRKSTRCKYPRQIGFRAGRHLHNGPRLPRLCSSLYFYPKPFNFYYKNQKQLRLSTSLLSQGRQKHRFAVRPDDQAQRLLRITVLSCCSSPNRLLRYRDQQKIHISNKQLHSASFDNCPALQMPLANRNLFQMDQAIPENQSLLRYQCQRCKDPNLECHQHLRAGSDCQEGTENRTEFERNPANSQHCTFRESSYYRSTYERYLAK